MKLFSLSEFVTKATEAFKRFPLTLIWVIVSSIVLIALVEQDADSIFEEYVNLSIMMVLGVSWLISSQFYIEQFKKKGLWWIKLIIVALLVVFYFALPEYSIDNYNPSPTPYIRWVLFFLAGHITLFFVPFVTVWHPKAYWNYLGNMMIAIARSALFSGVLYIGLVVAMLAIQYLFDVDIKGYRYLQLFIICLGIVNTWVYLSDFPREIQHNIHLTFHKPAEVFVKFILIPLTVLYLIILYAYAFKIIIQWELPKGWVSYLITALAGLLFVIQFIIHPVRISHESRLIRKFQPLVYYLLVPLLVLLYVAIYKRIADYGVTEARYFLILVAIFITGATLYLIVSRKQQLRLLPIALATLALVGSFGFWGAFSVSKRSQVGEFEKVYSAFAKAEKGTAVSTEQTQRFESITRYLAEREAYKEMEGVLGYNPKEAFTNVDTWNMSSKIMDSLEIKPSYSNDYQRRRYYTTELNQEINIEGYSVLKRFFLNKNDTHPETNKAAGHNIFLTKDGTEITIKKDEKIVMQVAIDTFLQRIDTTWKGNSEPVSWEALSLAHQNDSLKVKIYFQELTLDQDVDTPSVNYSNGTILFKSNKWYYSL